MVRHLGVVNWIVISVYLCLILFIGIFTKIKQKATKDAYLKGDGKVPSYVLAVSIWATTLSAITFVGFTATAFRLDWRYWIGIWTIFGLMPFVIKFIVPFFRKIKATTAYEYLEKRFHRSLRIVSSIIFILFHIGRIAIVIYIPTIAIEAATGINPYAIALIVGTVTVVYTFFGGLKGVIWTDFIQGLVFLFGIVLTVFLAIYANKGGFGRMMSDANAHGKFFGGGSTTTTIAIAGIPLIFFGQIFNNVYQYVGSQDVVQRYGGADRVKDVNRALIINGILAVVATAMLAFVGTLMWSYYYGMDGINGVPKDMIPSGKVSYPIFALDVLPIGISGLVIASIMAAAQSTIASSLSAVVSCVTVDILPLFKKFKSKIKNELTFAKIVTAIVGAFGTMLAIGLIIIEQNKLFDYWLGILGLFGGPVSVAFLLGIFTKKANWVGALSGLLLTFGICLVMWILKTAHIYNINSLWFPIFSMPIGIIIGYLVSIVFPKFNKNNIRPLTVYGLKDEYIFENENNNHISNPKSETKKDSLVEEG